MLKELLILLLFCCVAIPSVAGSEKESSWMVGQRVPLVTFQDRFEQARGIAESTRLVLFAPDRAAAKLAHKVLKAGTGVVLSGGQEVVYFADISRMPGWVSRFFAVPKMEKYGYPIALGREPSDCLPIPQQSGSVSIISLTEDQIISRIRFTNDTDVIQSALKPFMPVD